MHGAQTEQERVCRDKWPTDPRDRAPGQPVVLQEGPLGCRDPGRGKLACQRQGQRKDGGGQGTRRGSAGEKPLSLSARAALSRYEIISILIGYLGILNCLSCMRHN